MFVKVSKSNSQKYILYGDTNHADRRFMNRRNRQIRCSDFPNLNKISAALLRAKHLDCSQSSIKVKDRQDRALTGTEGAGVAVYGGGGREARKISPPSKPSPPPPPKNI